MDSESNVLPEADQPEKPIEVLPTQPPAIDPEVRFLQEVGRPLFEMSGWLKFLGIGFIVYISLILVITIPIMAISLSASRIGVSDLFQGGVLVILLCTFVFALIPVALTIWIYYQLYKAGKFASLAQKNADKAAMITSLKSLKTYFIATGILTIIAFVGGLIYLCVLAFLIPAGMGNLF
jgi:hypothetical protein